MKQQGSETGAGNLIGLGDLGSAHRKTLEAVLRHPTAQNLEWTDVISLFERIGAVRQKSNDKVSFEFASQHLVLPRGHGKDLGASEVAGLRQLIQRAGGSGGASMPASGSVTRTHAAVVVEIDHHSARLFTVGPRSGDARVMDISPYDPHHFLHHLTHKDQSREQGQRSPEDPTFYARISEALANAPRIVVVGHGKGKSNAAAHLMEYLERHHPQTHQHVVRTIETDLSALTLGQIGALVQDALDPGGP